MTLQPRTRSRQLVATLLTATLLFVTKVAFGEERSVAEMMPDTAGIFLEINRPQEFQQLLRQGNVPPVVARLCSLSPCKPISLAVDAPTRGLLFTFDLPEESPCRTTLSTTHAVLRTWADRLGLGSFVYQHDIGTSTIRHVGSGGWFPDGQRLLMATRQALTLDTWLTIHDPKQPALAETEDYRAAIAELPSDRVATVFLRRAGQSQIARGLVELAQVTAGIAVAEADLPPPLGQLAMQTFRQPIEEVRYVAAAVSLGETKPHITVILPEESTRLASTLRVLAAIPQSGRTSVPLVPSNTIVSVSTYLNRQAVELAIASLFSPEQLASLQATNPEVAALVEGLSFTLDAVEQIEPRVQVVFARKPFAALDQEGPQLRLPAVAVVFVPKNPKQMKQVFSLAFMGAMSEANKTAKHENRPRYRLSSQHVGEVTVSSGILRKRTPDQQPPTLLQASLEPTIAFLDRRFIFATNQALAVELVELAAHQPDITIDTSLRIDVGPTEVLRSTIDNYEASSELSEPLGELKNILGPILDSLVAAARPLLEQTPASTLPISQPSLVLPFTLEVKTE